MTTPPPPADEPRYGRRVEPGAPDGAPYGQPQQAPGAGPQHYGQAGHGTQPPQYGQPGHGGGQQPYPPGQAQPYPAYGTGAPAPGGRPPRRTGPVWTIILGALFLVGGPVGGVILSVVMALGGAGGLAGLADSQTVPNGGTVQLQADTERAVFVDVDGGERMTCDITGPGGQPVAVSDYSLGVDEGSTGLAGVKFRTDEAGAYTVECDVPGGASGPLVVSEPVSLDGIMDAGIFVLVGFLVGLGGLVALIIGIIWLVRVNRRIRDARGW